MDACDCEEQGQAEGVHILLVALGGGEGESSVEGGLGLFGEGFATIFEGVEEVSILRSNVLVGSGPSTKKLS